MDMQSQMRRPYGDDQAEDPIRIHHPEEEEHQEKGATKVLKKVKEKAKKIKNSLTKHGQGHEQDHDVDEEDDEYDEQHPEVHGAPVIESSAMRGGVTGQPESLSHTGETNVPAPEEIIPPGTKVFPVVSSDYTKPVEPEPLRDTVYGHEALSDPVRTTDGEEKRGEYSHPLRDISEREESREAHQGGGEAGVPEIAESLGRTKVTDESPDQKSGLGFESDLQTKSQGYGLKKESEIGKDSPTGFGGESGAGIGKDSPTRGHEFDQKNDSGIDKNSARNDEGTRDEAKPSTYTEKLGSATSFVTDKAIAAKNAVASKLGYSGGGGVQQQSPVGDDETTPRSATGYGQKVARTVAEKLTPVYEKVKETGSTVMTKLPLSGGGSVAEEKQQGVNKGVPTTTRDYFAEKLRPGDEDKALSEMIAEKLHLGGGGGGEKKMTTTKEVEVNVEKIPSDQVPAEKIPSDQILEEKEHGQGMVGKLKGAVTSWLGGTTEELKPKSSDSVDESSQSLGSTVGTTGFSDSGGAVPAGVRGLQDSGH